MEIEQEFKEIKEAFLKMETKKELLSEELYKLEERESHEEERLENLEKSQIIIQEVSLSTQRNLEYHISNLVTTAISSIDPTWPEFVARIEIQRNKTECNLFFREEGVEQRPEECSGGGVKDVASFALKMAQWSLKKNRPVFIEDEPFRNVSPDLQKNISEMVTMMSKELEVQIILVSHQDDVNIAADKTFWVEKEGLISIIKEE